MDIKKINWSKWFIVFIVTLPVIASVIIVTIETIDIFFIYFLEDKFFLYGQILLQAVMVVLVFVYILKIFKFSKEIYKLAHIVFGGYFIIIIIFNIFVAITSVSAITIVIPRSVFILIILGLIWALVYY